jgi:hypothetical protein
MRFERGLAALLRKVHSLQHQQHQQHQEEQEEEEDQEEGERRRQGEVEIREALGKFIARMDARLRYSCCTLILYSYCTLTAL